MGVSYVVVTRRIRNMALCIACFIEGIYKRISLLLKNDLAHVIFVNPEDLVSWCPSVKKSASNLVLGGDWDTKCVPFLDMAELCGFSKIERRSWRIATSRKKAATGISFSETDAPYYLMKEIELFGATDGCLTREDVLLRYSILDSVAKDISAGHFKIEGQDALSVAIDREGGLHVVNGGFHRLGIAQGLKLRKIPVRLAAVHKVAIRKGFYKMVVDGADKSGR